MAVYWPFYLDSPIEGSNLNFGPVHMATFFRYILKPCPSQSGKIWKLHCSIPVWTSTFGNDDVTTASLLVDQKNKERASNTNNNNNTWCFKPTSSVLCMFENVIWINTSTAIFLNFCLKYIRRDNRSNKLHWAANSFSKSTMKHVCCVILACLQWGVRRLLAPFVCSGWLVISED